ncbi:MAG TPA: hypothetical protein VFE32_19585 [Puia sp.]|jgi:hypothetical protein|nr:hypothetical protein [Puia sp.]
MERYRNFSGKSGVIAFEIGTDNIKVQFLDGSVYLYDYSSPGIEAVRTMKTLAKKGSGLSTFISTSVRDRYAARLK